MTEVGKRFTAEQTLLYSEKNSGVRKKFTVKICQALLVAQEDVDFTIDGFISRCDVEIDGIELSGGLDHISMDSVQAVNMASNFKSLIKRLSKK